MIVKETSSKWTKIIICKYDSYQDRGQTKGKQKTNKGQTKGKQRATENKEVIMINNEIIKLNKNLDALKKEIYDFYLYRKKIKKPFKTVRGFESFQSELLKLSNNNLDIAKKILNQSMDKEWQGIFELKNNTPKNKLHATPKDQSTDFSDIKQP